MMRFSQKKDGRGRRGRMARERKSFHAIKRVRQILQQEMGNQSQDIVALANEITLHKREIEHKLDMLQIANEQLTYVNNMQSDFVSIVSHEFRSTLTSIQGFSELMHNEDFSFEEIKEYAAIININAKRLNTIISELLDQQQMKS